MERPGVMELRWPMRILKIELSGSLAERRDFGKSETGVLAIDLETRVPRIGLDPIVLYHFRKLSHTLPVSGYSFRGRLVWITIDAEGCVTGVITMQGDCRVDIGYAQLHRHQLGIKLDGIDNQSLDTSRFEHVGHRC
jgi:hypothetical protein